ncbi:MAG: hypothetical protein ACOY0R_04910, partial [Chloroflexota bacterium]
MNSAWLDFIRFAARARGLAGAKNSGFLGFAVILYTDHTDTSTGSVQVSRNYAEKGIFSIIRVFWS